MALINNETTSPQVQASTCILGQKCVVGRSERGTGFKKPSLMTLFVYLYWKKKNALLGYIQCLFGFGGFWFVCFLFGCFFCHTTPPCSPHHGLYSGVRESVKIYLFGNTSVDIVVCV